MQKWLREKYQISINIKYSNQLYNYCRYKKKVIFSDINFKRAQYCFQNQLQMIFSIQEMNPRNACMQLEDVVNKRQKNMSYISINIDKKFGNGLKIN